MIKPALVFIEILTALWSGIEENAVGIFLHDAALADSLDDLSPRHSSLKAKRTRVTDAREQPRK
jgi:hypothetical protein